MALLLRRNNHPNRLDRWISTTIWSIIPLPRNEPAANFSMQPLPLHCTMEHMIPLPHTRAPIPESIVPLTHGDELFTKFFIPLLSSLSDTQLATGLGVMIAGWIQFPRNLSVYHFTIISDLAWLASNTQLTCHFTLHQCVRSLPGPHRSTFLAPKLIRVCCMICQFVMLFYATTIQGHQCWWDSFGCLASCLAKNLELGGEPQRWILANYFMLIWGYGAAFSQLLEDTNTYQTLEMALLSSCVSPIVVFLDSMTFDILFASAWFGVGIRNLMDDRSHGRNYFETGRGQEDQWGFGQILPMVVLIIPILAALDNYGSLGLKAPEIRSRPGTMM